MQKLYINIVNLTPKISYSLFFDPKLGAKKSSLFSGFYSKYYSNNQKEENKYYNNSQEKNKYNNKNNILNLKTNIIVEINIESKNKDSSKNIFLLQNYTKIRKN
jgi:hypothetical protein